jgi:hypothetical protein
VAVASELIDVKTHGMCWSHAIALCIGLSDSRRHAFCHPRVGISCALEVCACSHSKLIVLFSALVNPLLQKNAHLPPRSVHSRRVWNSSNKLNNTSRLLDLPLGLLAHISCSDNDRNLRYPSLAQNLAVAKREQIENGCSIGFLVGEVGFSCFGGDEGPQLRAMLATLSIYLGLFPTPSSLFVKNNDECARSVSSYLVKIDTRFPKLILRLMEVSHADLSKVTRVVLVDVGAVVVLATGHTATTGVLAVLADAAVAG